MTLPSAEIDGQNSEPLVCLVTWTGSPPSAGIFQMLFRDCITAGLPALAFTSRSETKKMKPLPYRGQKLLGFSESGTSASNSLRDERVWRSSTHKSAA